MLLYDQFDFVCSVLRLGHLDSEMFSESDPIPCKGLSDYLIKKYFIVRPCLQLSSDTMAPTAVYSETTPIATGVAVTPPKGSALAIGSLSTAEDGKYQSLVSTLGEARDVEKQMLDRLVDGGECNCYLDAALH